MQGEGAHRSQHIFGKNMNFNFGWDKFDTEVRCYGGRECNGLRMLFLGPKGWLFSLEQGTHWCDFAENSCQFVLANGTVSYSFLRETVHQSTELVFEGTDIPKMDVRRQIPPTVYELLCRRYKKQSPPYDLKDRCDPVIETFWLLQILKESIAKGLVHMQADVVLTPCKSLLDHLELQPVSSLRDRKALCKSLLLSPNLHGNRGMQDLYLAQQEKTNVWWVPLFAFPENAPSFVVQCFPEDFRLVQVLPFAVIIENKEKEQFSLFVVDTVEGAVERIGQLKKFTDLLPFLVQRTMQDLLQVKGARGAEVNTGKLCSMRAWSLQARDNNPAETVGDIEKLQLSLRQWALEDDFYEGPDLRRLIRDCCVSKSVIVQ